MTNPLLHPLRWRREYLQAADARSDVRNQERSRFFRAKLKDPNPYYDRHQGTYVDSGFIREEIKKADYKAKTAARDRAARNMANRRKTWEPGIGRPL